MYLKELKKTALLLIIGGAINAVSAQESNKVQEPKVQEPKVQEQVQEPKVQEPKVQEPKVQESKVKLVKIGDDPFIFGEKSAVLEVKSTKKGFLPPRMPREKRNAIVDPVEGLLVWCTDCKSSTNAIPGELSVWQGTAWTPFSFVTTPRLTTGKKTDTNKPVKAGNGVTVSGTLLDIFGAALIETGIVYREIKSNDFGTLPVLDAQGAATVPNYKEVGTLVIKAGGAISATIPTLGTTRPYYFRTYAVSSSGIGYGNPVIFNLAPPKFDTVNVSDSGSVTPVFQCNLIVNAGTYPNSIKEFGYCSSMTNSKPTISDTKVVTSETLKGIENLTKLNNTLNSESFTADPVIDLSVNDYTVNTGTNYFCFYVITNDNPIPVYSEVKTLVK